MAATFKTGDVVKLASGGPDMTVNDATGPGVYKCQWFAGKKLEAGIFRADQLELVRAKT